MKKQLRLFNLLIILFLDLSLTDILNAQTNTWVQKNDVGYSAPNGPGIRSQASGFSIGSKVYVGTGLHGVTKLNDFWEYDTLTDTWAQKANFGGPERCGAVGFSIGNKGYIGTGRVTVGIVASDFWEYDPTGNTWTQKASITGSRCNAFGFSIGTKGYIGSGTNYSIPNGGIKKDFWEYDPVGNTWTQKVDFGGGLRREAVGFSIGGKGYAGTGYSWTSTAGQFLTNDFWEYNPITNSWVQKANFSGSARSLAVGFSIGIMGYIGTGSDLSPGYNILKDFWQYDSSTDTWTQKSNVGGTERAEAIGISIGSKAYIGLGIYDNDFWEYDTTANSWTEKTNLGAQEIESAVGFSIGNKGYIGTGLNGGSSTEFWEYDPANNTWEQKANFAGSARVNAVGFSIGSKGYVGTGYDSIARKDFWEYDTLTNSWTQKADFGGAARGGAVGFSIGNKGYIGTGYATVPTFDFWEYNPVNDTWTQKASIGNVWSVWPGRHSGVGFSMGGKGYLGFGYYASGYGTDFWEYDPTTDTWTLKGYYNNIARGGGTAFSIGNKGYVGTGYNSTVVPLLKDLWEYDAISNTWDQKLDLVTERRQYAVGFSIGQKGYIGTGEGYYTSLSDFSEYTPDGLVTKNINDSAFCAGASVNVPFTTGIAIINSGNTFTAELSDSSGSFSSPVIIGTLLSTSSDSIAAVIPANTPPGNGYRIRVVSSNPPIITDDNGHDITISSTPPIVSGTIPDSVCILGLVALQATASSGILKWYDVPSGGTPLFSGSPFFVGINTNTTYYVEAYNGCVSPRVPVTGIIKLPSSDTLYVTACDQYTIGGNTYFSNGLYTSYFPNGNAVGCDSTLYTYFTINFSNVGTVNVTACNDFTWYNQTYSQSGAYNETLTNVYGCDSIVTLNLTINPLDTSVTQNGITITANVTGAIYQWINCFNGAVIPGATGQSFTPSTNGNYAVKITKNNCADTSACVNIGGVSIDEMDLQNVAFVFPNPSDNKFIVQFNKEQNCTSLNLYNVIGDKVLEQKEFSGTVFTFDISEKASGIYFLEIRNNDLVSRIRIVKN